MTKENDAILKNQIQTQVVRVYGIVQGVGFRPFVSRIAMQAGVTGSVANKGSYVEIFIRGNEMELAAFHKELRENPPERSAVLKIDCMPHEDMSFDKFEIIESEKEAGDIFVSPDIATCPKCKEELYDQKNRRYMHPFINCTACGPRLTILDAMPYDRERTSMKEFPMCPQCDYEYHHAETRRYDAQPVCCNDCGPEVYLIGRTEKNQEAITYVRKAILDGKIVAIKGIGGFHLCCDARNQEAVMRLRQMKNRPAKPFAVMMQDLETVERECELLEPQKEILDGHQKPIILLKKKKNGAKLAPAVAPGNPKIGVMLPYAPVQMLLFDYNDDVNMTTDCFVMTSGNVSGAPICRTDEDAICELSGFCDIMLSHNRKIRLRADDSVMDFYEGKPYMIRRSRGYAPLPSMLSKEWKGQVLAVGGELKNTFCIGKNQLFYPSPYVGDMADYRTVEALEESIVRMEQLLEVQPEVVACDMHPKYNTTVVAEEQKLPMIQVQHHYAHIVSCMAENDYSDLVIGVSFDGTGYGTDATIWGGEFLLADYHDFTREGSIRPFMQVGGDISAKEGWRIAVSMLNDCYGDDAKELVEVLGLCEENVRKLYAQMSGQKINSVVSTSAGRLFDAVSAILGIRLQSSFEGEASMSLEFAAEEYEESIGSKQAQRLAGGVLEAHQELITLDIEEGFFKLPTDLLVKYLTQCRLRGESPEKLAYEFHRILAEQIVTGCQYLSSKHQLMTCALSGGVFQNQLLLRLCEHRLKEENFKVLRHSLIPPNDGGISLGQAVVAMTHINS